jgi:PelA/Pel-15E family pectate lyase
MISKLAIVLVMTSGAVPVLRAAVIGTNVPSQPLTTRRIAMLPASQRSEWTKYLERSQQRLRQDKDSFLDEMKAHGVAQATNAPRSRGFRGIPLNRPQEWYGSAEARRIAVNVISYQTPSGGWGKQVDMTSRPRVPGETFTSDNTSRFAAAGDFDVPSGEAKWNYVGTFDNNATITQLRYLAKVAAAAPTDEGSEYRRAFLHGLDYIFASQYPNGGWPQIWPLEGGYHDAITYNDGSMVNALQLLDDAAKGGNEFAFVPKKMRKRAAASLKRGVECILETQIVVDGQRTVWCQQHDMLTLKPTSARNYEMPSKSAIESAGITMFLMKLPEPDAKTVAAIKAAAAWFKKTELRDVAFRNSGSEGRLLVSAPGDGPIWARYYDIATDRPIFGDRDKSIHDTVAEISPERRRGYSWFGDSPKEALSQFERWSKRPL